MFLKNLKNEGITSPSGISKTLKFKEQGFQGDKKEEEGDAKKDDIDSESEGSELSENTYIN
jgi:hypothetical protein